MPSYMRAPPEAQTTITGSFSAVPRSMRRAIFSPTTEPMLAPRNSKSMTPSAMARPDSRARPQVTASTSPVLRRLDSSFSW